MIGIKSLPYSTLISEKGKTKLIQATNIHLTRILTDSYVLMVATGRQVSAPDCRQVSFPVILKPDIS